tara:strand:+ start:322 stop:495 length:174 start_codon:yes stop_codon:yes gene_type:complete
MKYKQQIEEALEKANQQLTSLMSVADNARATREEVKRYVARAKQYVEEAENKLRLES